MLKIIKFTRNLVNQSSIRYASSRRYQFKVEEPIYYPKRDLSNEDAIKASLHMKDNAQLLTSSGVVPSIDYYKILGVQKIASTQEIKSAYYNLAKKYHPDASPTPQETKSFQQISEAYHVLSDENTRMEYDRFGMVKNVQPFLNTITLGDKTFNIERKKPKLLRFKDEPNLGKNEKRVALKEIGRNEVELELKFLQAVQGSKEYIDLKSMVKCPRCNGSNRLGNQVNIEFCQKCGGTGEYRVRSDTYTAYKVCDCCDGKRYVNKNSCKTCDNRGYVVQSRRVEVNIPPGTANGDIVKVTNPLNKQIVKVILNVDKSSYFKRDGNNVSSDKYLTISQAVLGGKFKVRGLYEDLEVNLGPGVESHTTFCFKGKGINTNSAIAGDHVVTFKIRVPKSLTTKQRQLMLALSRTEDPTFDGQ